MSGTGPSAGQDVAANRELWAQVNAEYSAEHAFGAWAAGDITWGVFNVPEGQPGVLGDVSGPDVVELGCGTAHFSAWLAGRGPGRWAWASAPPSWPPRAAARNGSGSGSRSSRRTPALSRCLTGASTWPSPSAGRACGVTRPAGCPRPPVCCAQVGGWCFTPPAFWLICACHGARDCGPERRLGMGRQPARGGRRRNDDPADYTGPWHCDPSQPQRMTGGG